MEKILLHICCAICCLSSWDELCEQFVVEGYWYNPNIQPQEEYDIRFNALSKLQQQKSIPIHIPKNNDPLQWIDNINKIINENKDRCLFCYRYRLTETAEYARLNNFKYFSTTLLSSPYQKHQELKNIGQEIGEKFGLTFHYQDLREFHYQGKKTAREMYLYSQKYCGCLYSRQERGIL